MICIAAAVFLVIWSWIKFVTRFPRLTVRDVYAFFHRIEGEILVGSFHTEPEENYRAAHTQAEFWQWQWRRIHLGNASLRGYLRQFAPAATLGRL